MTAKATDALGIDLGRTWIKSAVVDTNNGTLVTERINTPAPRPLTPAAALAAITTVIDGANWRGPIGIALPGVVKNGTVLTADQIDESWINLDALAAFTVAGLPTAVLNDADAAGIAEMRFGAGRGRTGVVVIVTLGTGIGVSLFTSGTLVPNVELGDLVHLIGSPLPDRTSAQGMATPEWRAPLNKFFLLLESLMQPDLIIVGGGAVESATGLLAELRTATPLVAAIHGNNAGLVGAAIAAGQLGPPAHPAS